MKTKITQDGFEFDSTGELYFYWWLQDLLAAGHITSIVRAPTYRLTESGLFNALVNGIEAPKTMIREQSYTPDFACVWTEAAAHKLYMSGQSIRLQSTSDGRLSRIGTAKSRAPLFQVGPNLESVWEVKGIAGNQAAARASEGQFRSTQILRKWLWARHRVFANLAEIGQAPTCWFAKTFTPRRYLLTDKTRAPRKISFPVRTLTEWLS